MYNLLDKIYQYSIFHQSVDSFFMIGVLSSTRLAEEKGYLLL